MILDIIVGFLLLDASMAFLFWALTYGEFSDIDARLTKAEKARDRGIDNWFRAQGEFSGEESQGRLQP